ncbi:MAG: DUF1588 domain-containing protein [Myxococcota bacterium]
MQRSLPVLLLGLFACVGEIGGSGAGDVMGPRVGEDGVPGDTMLPPDSPSLRPTDERACDDPAAPPVGSVRPRTTGELVAGLEGLLGPVAQDPDVVRSLSLLRRDRPDNVGAATTQRDYRADDLLSVMGGVAQVVARRADEVLVECPADCRLGALDFAERAFGRPLVEGEVADFDALFADFESTLAIELAVLRTLLSPSFTEHVVLGAEEEGDRIRLRAEEVAARLSLSLTGTPPDQALIDAVAEAGDAAALTELASTLIDTPAGRAHIAQLLRHWLLLDGIPEPEATVAERAGVDRAGMSEAASEELMRFLDDLIFERDGTFADLFLDTMVYPVDARLAETFGVPVGERTESASHGGILRRPATLQATSPYPSVVVRGLFVRHALLCETIPMPDDAVVADRLDELGELSPAEYSQREIITQQTAELPCASCHDSINPTGFAFEGFDTLGRVRDVQEVYDASGALIATHGVDTTGSVLIDGALRPVDGIEGLAQALAESTQAQRCFTTRMVELTRQRPSTPADGCVLRDLDALVAEGASVREVLVQSVVNEQLLWRAAEETGR